MIKKMYILLLPLMLLIPTKFVLANNLTITMPGITQEDKNRGNDKLGDCTIMSSNGDILLIDTCDIESSAFGRVKEILENAQYNNLYIYISHYHSDHYNGLTELLNDDKIDINTIYLPKSAYICEGMADAKSILSDNPDQETYFSKKIEEFNEIIELTAQKNTKIVYLWPENTNYSNINGCFLNENNSISSFKFGDATVDIIGPIGNHSLNETGNNSYLNYRICHNVDEEPNCNVSTINNSDYQMKSAESISERKKYISTVGGDYINNMSLVARITIDNTTIFSAGDIEVEEEDALVNKYGNSLKSDIMKLSHHGYLTSNRKYFLQYIKPKYVFVNGLMNKPSSSKNCIFPDIGTEGDISNYRYSYIINGNEDYLGANIYVAGWNNETSISVNNNYIYASTTNNKKTITFESYDKKTNQKIETIEHDFSSDSGLPYKIYYNKIPITGYLFDNSNIPSEINNNTNLQENTSYKLEYVKAYNLCNNLICNDINKIIKNIGVTSKLEVSTVRERIDTENTINIDNETNEFIHTGNNITISNGNKDSINYTFILNGDLNSDGEVKKDDTSLIAKHIIDNRSNINNVYLSAADINNDNHIKINDLMILLRDL